MEPNRDPKICPSCETSNPWMNEKCRTCGAPLSTVDDPGPREEVPTTAGAVPMESTGEPAAVESPNKPPSRLPLNIRWIAACGFILALLVGGGEKWAESKIHSDPEKSAVVNDALAKSERGQELTDPEKAKVWDALMSDGWMVPLLVVMFLVFPFGIGVLVGYATGSIRDGILSVVLGMSGYFVIIAHFIPIVIVAVPVYSGVGAIASYFGKRLRY